MQKQNIQLFLKGAVELQLPAVSVPLSSVQTPECACPLYAMSSAQLDGSYSKDCAKPVLLDSTPVQLSGTST